MPGNVSERVANQLCPSGCLYNSTCPAPGDNCEPKAPYFNQEPEGHRTARWHYEPTTRLAIILSGLGRWENQHGPLYLHPGEMFLGDDMWTGGHLSGNAGAGPLKILFLSVNKPASAEGTNNPCWL